MFANRRQLFVRQHAGLLKLTSSYDIIDPANGQVIGAAKEVPPTWAKYLRLVVNKAMLPTMVEVSETGTSGLAVALHRNAGIFSKRVRVTSGTGAELGYFQSKAFSLGGALKLHDTNGRLLGEVKGDWKGWNFKMLDTQGRELGVITKKWAGIGKELFTTADQYALSLSEAAGSNRGLCTLLLAAGLAVDLVFKESSN